MTRGDSFFSATYLGDWLIAAGCLAGTISLVSVAKQFLNRLDNKHPSPLFHPIARSSIQLLYAVGLHLFLEFAPLESRVRTWMDGAVYIIEVIIYISVFKKIINTVVSWSVLKAARVDTLKKGFLPLLFNIITLFSVLTAAIMILKHFNYDVMSLLTALGVGSLAVGLAAKDTLSNMISGFILIIDQNVQPGDRIQLNSIVGDIEKIGLRSTQIKISNGNTLIVPNSELVNTQILNLSAPTRELACTSFIRLPLRMSFLEFKKICLQIIETVPNAVQTRAKWVNLLSLSDGHQYIQVGFWARDLDLVDSSLSQFHEQLIENLKQKEISLIQWNPHLHG